MHGGRRRLVVLAVVMFGVSVQTATAQAPGLLGAYQGRGPVPAAALGLLASVALTGVIGGLLIHRPRRRRSEQAALRRSLEQKDQKGQIEDLTRRLISAQEAERSHLARELHDDIGQQLASLSIALSGVNRRREILENPDLHAAIVSLQQRTDALTDSIRRLSHHLHPSVLDHASLSDALRGHCREFSREHKIAVTVEAGPDLQRVDAVSALTVYRVAQEALHNVARHANARTVRVALGVTHDDLTLSIADDGTGFDYREIQRRGTGLGLRSIEERVRLARGRFTIDSAFGVGTTLWIHLPIGGKVATSSDATTEH